MEKSPSPRAVAFAPAASDEDLRQILELQARHVEERLTPAEAKEQGFVTLRHELGLLREMNADRAHVVARFEGRVVGYALATSRAFLPRFPELAPVVSYLDGAAWRGLALKDRSLLVMGQICVDAPFRGTGVFASLYAELRALHSADFELLVTEVASRNGRSLRAHAKVGFELLHLHRDPDGEEWQLIVWEW